MAHKKYKWEQVKTHYGIKNDDHLIDFLERLLNEHETVDHLVEHLENEGIEISRETIDRFAAANSIKPFQCWRRVPPIINGTFITSVSTRPVSDAEGQAQP